MRETLTAESEKIWTTVLPAIEDNLNTTIHSVTGHTPKVLHLGTNPRLLATQQFLGDAPSADNFVDPDKAVAEAQVRMTNSANKRAEYFYIARSRANLFNVGDLVAIEDSQLAGGGKLKPKYKGPYTVRNVLQKHGGRRTTVVAHEQLRSWPSVQ